MKQNKTIEVTVCDVKDCVQEGDATCDLCKNDVCLDHLFEAKMLGCRGVFCRTHIDPEILRKLEK